MDAESVIISVATAAPPPLAEVRDNFEAWRAAKPHRNTPIPDALWEAALSLRAEMSMCAIGKALRLNPSHLADRARRREPRACGFFESGALVPTAHEGNARFVEIARPHPTTNPLCGFPIVARQVIEMRFPDGTTVSATHADPVDVSPFFRSLLSSRR